eukprot:6201647-Pleurochrysis_carterae.AAC.9
MPLQQRLHWATHAQTSLYLYEISQANAATPIVALARRVPTQLVFAVSQACCARANGQYAVVCTRVALASPFNRLNIVASFSQTVLTCSEKLRAELTHAVYTLLLGLDDKHTIIVPRFFIHSHVP